ncbi:LysE family translocator [Neisseria sp.]|uniref:LysE family translocator n=1 Tax=Neisseria sp. TaxID=192066 RepID=UPI00289813BC|nr:LysE family translocator [Neisseria sp.]
MPLETWLLFVSTTLLISATPGSNMLLAFQFGLNYGFRKTLWTLAGLSFGLLLLLLVSLAGIGLLSRQAPLLFDGLKVLGALYLAYLGIQTWRKAAEPMGSVGMRIQPSAAKLFQTGIAVSLSNPKAILFFAAFFPKFLNIQLPMMPQYLILTLTFFVIETIWQLIYTVGGKTLAAWLQQGRRLMWLNRLCGLIFILIAVGLIYDML